MSHSTRLLLIPLALLLTACGEDEDQDFLSGVLERDRIEIVAAASEPIWELVVREGEAVARGQVLGKLDDRRGLADLAAAQARGAAAEARIAELKRGARSERIDSLLAQITSDRAELAQAKLDLSRARRLVTDRVVPQEELDRALTRVDTSQARLRDHRAQLEEARTGATREELNQAVAELDLAHAEAARHLVDVERMTLRSPMDAVVEALPYEVGELPGAGATLVVLRPARAPHVRAYLPEQDFAKARVGLRASVEADGLEGNLDGCVRFLSHEASFTPHFALNEHDRHGLVFMMEVELTGAAARSLPSGLPVRLRLHPEREPCLVESRDEP